MITEKVEKALNKQMNKEMFSANLYLSMSAYCADQNFDGFAKWMFVQYQEEISHAMKLFSYINDRGGRVILESIDKPKSEWESILNVFEETLDHEREISASVNELTDIAINEKDHATVNFLQWFISEQVEEEATVSEIVSQIEMVKDHPHSLFVINKELGNRTFVDPNEE
ncbi:MAG: ferritin [Candidatus Cloacimonadota bacterium]|nr:MAG: ferritin [Candidatus Cloacimonadota bacterium]PIE77765.1 MAG: ferritin [Candidatus Delongbacteria bacterium]